MTHFKPHREKTKLKSISIKSAPYYTFFRFIYWTKKLSIIIVKHLFREFENGLCFGHFDELLDDDLKAGPHLLTAGDDLVGGQHKPVPVHKHSVHNMYLYTKTVYITCTCTQTQGVHNMYQYTNTGCT